MLLQLLPSQHRFGQAADIKIPPYTIQEIFEGKDGVTGFVGGNELRVSPDGRNVYALGSKSNSVVVFRRNVGSGKLAYLQTLYNSDVAGKHGSTSGIGISPDGVRRIDAQRDRGLSKTMTAWMSKRRTEAEDLLKQSGGILICRLRSRGEPLEISAGDAPAEHLDRYSWLPSVSLIDRHHQLVEVAGKEVDRHVLCEAQREPERREARHEERPAVLQDAPLGQLRPVDLLLVRQVADNPADAVHGFEAPDAVRFRDAL